MYETVSLEEFKHQLDDGIWAETGDFESEKNHLEMKVSEPLQDPTDSHTAQLIMLIDQFTDELHPLRHSNSYKFLKKKFEI